MGVLGAAYMWAPESPDVSWVITVAFVLTRQLLVGLWSLQVEGWALDRPRRDQKPGTFRYDPLG